MKSTATVLGAVLAVSSTASYASIRCEGLIENLFVDRTGDVVMHSQQMYGSAPGRAICNLSVARKGVSPETCRGWYAGLLSQVAANKPAVIYYSEAETATCSSVPTWTDAVAPWGVSNIP